MDMLQIMLWLIYPYSVVFIVGMGLIWQINAPSDEHEGEPMFMKRNKLLHRLILSVMALSFLTGIGVVVFYSMTDEPEKLFIWVKSLVLLKPDLELIKSISLLSRTHFLLLLTFLLLLSFSKYIKYLWKPHLFIKKRLSKRLDSFSRN